MLNEEFILALGRVVKSFSGIEGPLDEEIKDLLAEMVGKKLAPFYPSGNRKGGKLARWTRSMFVNGETGDWETEVDNLCRPTTNLPLRKIEELKAAILEIVEKTLKVFGPELDGPKRSALLKKVAARLKCKKEQPRA